MGISVTVVAWSAAGPYARIRDGKMLGILDTLFNLAAQEEIQCLRSIRKPYRSFMRDAKY